MALDAFLPGDLVEAMCRHDAKLRAKRLSDELSLGRP